MINAWNKISIKCIGIKQCIYARPNAHYYFNKDRIINKSHHKKIISNKNSLKKSRNKSYKKTTY